MKQIQLIGHTGKDHKILPKNNGYILAFAVAVTERYNDEKGEPKEITEWYQCYKYFREEPKKLLSFFRKGLKIFVQGKPDFTMTKPNENGKQQIYLNRNVQVDKFEILTSKKDSKK